MNILMINPPAENTVIENPDDDGEGFIESDDFGLFAPLGMLYVLSYLEKHGTGHNLYFKDCIAEHISHADLPAIVEEIQPDVVGVTSFTISLVDVCMVARTVREIVPDAHICLGGHHPIAFPHEAAKLKGFDSVIVGEGEVAFTGLVNALEKGEDITAIKGVYTTESIKAWEGKGLNDKRFLGHVMVPPAYIEDVDSLPFPNRKFIQHIDYHSIVGVTGKLATLISSRGCPYLCTFCDVPYKKYRDRSIESVLDEVEECLKLGYREFHFYDDLFNIQPKKIIAYADAIERRGLDIVWDFRGRVNTVTEESLIRAKRAGLRQISFGVETGSDEGLRALRKGSKIEQIQRAFGWCRKHGITTIADFMIGMPFEKTKEDVKRNIDFLIDLEPDYMQLAILTLYPNTQLYEQALAKNLAQSDRWLEFVRDPKPGFEAQHWEEHLSIRELVRLQHESYSRFYLRPSYILRSVLRTRTWYEFKTKFGGMMILLRSWVKNKFRSINATRPRIGETPVVASETVPLNPFRPGSYRS